MSQNPRHGSSCDWQPPSSLAPLDEDAGLSSAVYRHQPEAMTWSGVALEAYKASGDDWCGIVRQVLIGQRGERGSFDLRYFEIAPGGNSSLEKHQHVHVVVVVRGRGRVLAGGVLHELAFLDTVYIAPDDPHQLLNPYDEPFGFFCLVDHERDRPQLLDRP